MTPTCLLRERGRIKRPPCEISGPSSARSRHCQVPARKRSQSCGLQPGLPGQQPAHLAGVGGQTMPAASPGSRRKQATPARSATNSRMLAARHSAISIYSAANPGSSRAARWMMQSTGDGRTDVVRSADPRVAVDLKPAQKRLIFAQSNVMLNDLTSHADAAVWYVSLIAGGSSYPGIVTWCDWLAGCISLDLGVSSRVMDARADLACSHPRRRRWIEHCAALAPAAGGHAAVRLAGEACELITARGPPAGLLTAFASAGSSLCQVAVHAGLGPAVCSPA